MGIRIGSVVRAVGLVGVLVFALAACGGADPADDAVDAAKEIVKEAGGADRPNGAAAEPVDTCALFTAADFASAMGKAAGAPESLEPRGSLLGGCTYRSEDVSMSVSVTARPAREWDATLKAYDGTSVSGVGKEAVWADRIGLLVLPAGKPYFLQVLVRSDVLDPTVFNKDLSVQIGELVASR